MLTAFVLSLRPKQWIKNLLLFAGLIFAQRFTDVASVMHAVSGFAVFCVLSGVVYIVNDILDVEQDREHPKKRLRPIAAGRISPAAAGTGAAVLAVVGLGAGFFLLPPLFGLLALIYLVLTCGYSVRLKHVVLLDILVLALGFVLRALGGIVVIDIYPANPVEITSYFLLTTLFLALFLASAKRRSELVALGEEAASHRKVLEDYSQEFLDAVVTVAAAGTIFSYALWTTQGQFARAAAEEGVRGDSWLLVLTMPFVLYGIFRYLWLVLRRGEGGAPEAVLLEDIPLLATVALWMLTVVAVLLHLSWST